MSKIDAGRAPLAPSSLQPARAAGDLTSMFRCARRARVCASPSGGRPGVPAVLLADEKKLRQILINLLGNAIKFTDHGEVRCGVTARRESRRDALWLAIDVEDTGPGVPASEAERIFHAFEQAEVRPGAGGTGLGLAISREFARLMGGEITLESELGQGSRFRLDVPVAVGTIRRADARGVAPSRGRDPFRARPLPCPGGGRSAREPPAAGRDAPRRRFRDARGRGRGSRPRPRRPSGPRTRS